MIIGISGYIGSGKDTVAKMIQFIIAQYEIHGQIYDKFDPSVPEYRYSAHWEIKKFAGKLKQMVSLLTGIPVGDLELQSVKDKALGDEWNQHNVSGMFQGTHGQFREFCKDPNISAFLETPIRITDIDYKFRYLQFVKRMTVRELLQKLGTDAMRDNVHSNIHVNALFADYKQHFTTMSGNGHRGHMCNMCDKIIEDASQYICDSCLKTEGWPNWLISDTRFPNEAQAIKDKGGVVIRIERYNPQDGSTQGWGTTRHASETSLDNWPFDYTINNSGSMEDLLTEVRKMLVHFKLI